jgi:hypothetical protein
MVWDAAAYWIVDRLDAEGALPAVRRLRAHGVSAAARPPVPNCQTPPSLATLFTGVWPPEHGVTGFTVPGPAGHPVDAHRSAFSGEFPLRPPIWRTLAERGLRSAFVHTPWVFDDAGGLAPETEVAIEAYRRRRARHDLLTVNPGARYDWPVAGHEVSVLGDAGRARLSTAGAVHELGRQAGWVPVRLPDGLGFWARYIDAGGPAVVRTGVWSPRVGGTNTALAQRLSSALPFAGEGVGSFYRAGRLGPRLVDGGDGTAEQAFLSSVHCVSRAFDEATGSVLAGHDSDLVVVYLPMTDDVGHELAGWCDATSAAYHPDVAGEVWELLRRCYRDSDRILARVLDRAGPADTVLLTADHGMAGSAHLVHINEQLIRAGLATRAADRTLDATRSAVIYHPANNGSLWVNQDSLPGGTVPALRTGEVLGQAMAVLTGMTGPDGQRVVREFVDESGRPVSRGGSAAVAYLVLADDYQPTATVDGGEIVRPMTKTAAHIANTGSARLHAIFCAAGPGIPAGLNLGLVDNTLPAELVGYQLGAGGPPAALTGHLSRPPVVADRTSRSVRGNL